MRSSSSVILSIAASLLRPAAAHGFVTGVRVNDGTWFAGADPVWYYYPAGEAPATTGWDSLNQDLGFVEPAAFGTSDISCHKSAMVGEKFIEAKAGDELTFFWNTWPDSHKGPIINYIAPYDSKSLAYDASCLW